MILPHEPTAATGAPLDLDLIRKYAIAGPRYTSYPPATRFTPDFDWERLEAAIAADNRPGAGPLSLYFHLPFCESLCWYCGCNTVITRWRESARGYLGDLEGERNLPGARRGVLGPPRGGEKPCRGRGEARPAGRADSFRRRHADVLSAGGAGSATTSDL